MEQAMNMNGRHAIVIGGSLVGLITAQLLTRHFEVVTVLERDQFPDEIAYRKGVPQARHLHILLSRGIEAMETIFPGIGAEMAEQGGKQFDLGQDAMLMVRGSWAGRPKLGINGFDGSRTFLEYSVRQRVRANPKVRLWQGADVTQILADEACTRIAGVQIAWRRQAEEAGPEELTADLVIDASGRSSRTPQWLAQLGYDEPEETIVNAFLGYATRRYERPSHFNDDWRIMLVSATPPYNPRGGAILQEENGNWVVTLAGTARHYPPTDEAGFLDFAQKMSTEFYEAIKEAKPLSSISGYQRTENRWRRYERLSRMPGHFALVGDSVCAFNPIYGQGITVGALSALALSEQLAAMGEDLSKLAHLFQKRIVEIAEPVWLLATSEDSRWPTTEGSSTNWFTRLSYWYVDKVVLTLVDNVEVHKAFIEVQQLLQPPAHLFKPFVVMAVLGRLLRRRR